jgi:GNAT superfamily N-acetyltransferase
MSLQIIELRDPVDAYELAREFLLARPIEHNLLLTILQQSREFALGGRFWVVREGTEVVGFALESPVGMGAVLAPMPADSCRLLAETIAEPLPRVLGEAGGAAAFAGRWSERRSISVREIEGQRLYALTGLKAVANARGSLRPGEPADRDTLVEWFAAFVAEVGDFPRDVEAAVDLRLERKQFWVWDDGGVVSMASASEPQSGVSRVGPVYTPAARRGCGYATACVEHTSRVLTGRGLRCVLYTDLANPTSNAIYRRIGYEAAAEILAYKFA